MSAFDWHEFKRTLSISMETANHPHSADECPDLFSSVGREPTEIDYLDLIHAIVIARKPRRALETGTHLGLSATAIAFALNTTLSDSMIRTAPSKISYLY